MRIRQQSERVGYLQFLTLGTIVLAFMALSLTITATGTARFAVAMGYRAEIGYGVGAVFDMAKGLLPIALLAFLARRTFLFFVVIGFAWLGLVTYSALATHATVSTAIAAIERSGSWKMEVRSGIKAELDAIEKRLEVLAQPMPPRPSKTLAEALAVEKVPPGTWRDSQECQSIRDSKYFQTACAKVQELRRELAAAKDYEQLDAQARELRQSLAAAPPVAISDPLPVAFASTIGHLLPLDGRSGVALLLTLVIEIMSCFGLAALRALNDEGREAILERGSLGPAHFGEGQVSGTTSDPDTDTEIADHRQSQIVPLSSLKAAKIGFSGCPASGRDDHVESGSNVIPLPRKRHRENATGKASTASPSAGAISRECNHVSGFVAECLRSAAGTSLGASELRARYETWCALHGLTPLSPQKFGAELTGLGLKKWKSCGVIRYRDLQFAA